MRKVTWYLKIFGLSGLRQYFYRRPRVANAHVCWVHASIGANPYSQALHQFRNACGWRRNGVTSVTLYGGLLTVETKWWTLWPRRFVMEISLTDCQEISETESVATAHYTFVDIR